MTLTARDRKIVIVLVPLVLVLAYWFAIFSPQRSESAKLDESLSQVESDRDNATAQAQSLQASKATYASDYETVVRLGKAVPTSLDMPSLLVQLGGAAKGAGIDFDSITAGPRTPATSTTTASGSGSSSSAAPPVAAGGTQAQTGAGKATEKANNAASTSNQANQAAGASTPAGSGAAAATTSPGFDTVPLTFSFAGSYFDLADFFHRVKRFVKVANGDNVQVKGRLMTIDGFDLKSDKDFPMISAELTATIYLSPKAQGANAGGTAQGPSTTTTTSSSTSSTTPPTSGSTSTSGSSAPTSNSSGAAQ